MRSMELYRSLGLIPAIRKAGESMKATGGMHRGKTLYECISKVKRKEASEKKMGKKLFELFEGIGPEMGMFITLDMIEPVLLDAARERGVDARFGTDCSGVTQDADRIMATLRDRKSGQTTEITADYCIAADGANSPIREALGIQRSGTGFLGNLLNILFRADLVSFTAGREFSLCKIEQPENNVWGLIATIDKDRWVYHHYFDPLKGEKPEDFPHEKCEQLVRLALGMPDPDLNIDISAVLPWQATVRVVEREQDGRIFLAGDAAHQMPPYAGQGANSGVQDVHNLAWKIATVLKGFASPKLLQTYEAERLPVGRSAAEISGIMTTDGKGLIAPGLSLTNLNAYSHMLPRVAGFGYFYYGSGVVEENPGLLGGLSWKSWSLPSLTLGLDGKPGSRAPHVWLERHERRISSTDLFGKNFVLLIGSEGRAWKDAAEVVAKKLGGIQIDAYSVGPKGDVVDTERAFETAAGISSNGVLLVRPDGFVALRERRIPQDHEGRLESAMRQVLCI